MGLGLSIAYNIVKLHKGTIKVDNKNIEKGTRMIVKLPIKQKNILANEYIIQYDEKTSREIYEYIVSEYIDLFENLKKKLNEEIL